MRKIVLPKHQEKTITIDHINLILPGSIIVATHDSRPWCYITLSIEQRMGEDTAYVWRMFNGCFGFTNHRIVGFKPALIRAIKAGYTLRQYTMQEVVDALKITHED